MTETEKSSPSSESEPAPERQGPKLWVILLTAAAIVIIAEGLLVVILGFLGAFYPWYYRNELSLFLVSDAVIFISVVAFALSKR